MTVLKQINLALAFLLELVMLAAFIYWGFQTGTETIVKIILGVGAALVAVVIWGRFMAPRSPRRLKGTAYIILKFVLFGIAALALVAVGQTTIAIIFIAVAIINQILASVWKQE